MLTVGCFALPGGQHTTGVRSGLFVLLATILGLAELSELCFGSSAALPDSATLRY